MQSPFAEIAAPADAPKHRWTARKLIKRAVLGIVILFGLVGGGAWMLHAGISTDGARNLEAINSSSVYLTDGPIPQHGPASAPRHTLILAEHASADVLERIREPGGEVLFTATLAARSGATLATLKLMEKSLNHTAVQASSSSLFSNAEQLLAVGFRGLVLDISSVSTSALDVVAEQIQRLVRHVRHHRPATLILLQGHEEIIARSDVLRLIDGFLDTEIFSSAAMSGDTPDAIVLSADFAATRHYLDRVARSGKLVLMATEIATPAKVENRLRQVMHALSYKLVQRDRATLKQTDLRGRIEDRESVSFSSTRLDDTASNGTITSRTTP